VAPTNALIVALTLVAEETRDRILRDRLLGLPDPSEETHTQNLVSRLAELSRGYGLTLVAREVPRYTESHLLGADIAFWVLGRTGTAGLHLQAKRLFPDDTYRDLGHANSRGRQVDTLITGASSVGAGAGYIFYNGLTGGQPTGSACCLLDYSPARNGVSLAPAMAVEPFVGGPGDHVPRVSLEDVCTPLVCVPRCCQRTLAHREDDLASVLRSWYATQTDEDLGRIAVGNVPTYARPLFDDLAGALGIDPWSFEDAAPRDGADDVAQRSHLDDRENVDGGDEGSALAIAVASTPR
jgi:hypothetical protein